MLGLLALGVAVTLGAAGCGPQGEPDQERQMAEWSEYEGKIQRTLFELTTSRDPASYAKEHDLDYYAMARVVIELAEGSSLPQGYLIEVERQAERSVQALVPLDQLLELSKRPEVQYIRAPVKPKPD